MLASAVKSSPQKLLVLLLLIFGVMALVSHLRVAPRSKIGNVAKHAFSAQRAQAHVEKIAIKPHPSGSVANAEVRDYLVENLEELGAEVELQRKLQIYDDKPRPGQARFSYVENVVARFKGKQSDKAILLMAHYDSKPNTPGAGDNASGVAAIIETVRALTDSGLPMKNSLIVLFSDAEELGLLGSQAFFGHHRWAEQVSLVLNLDSRGTRGPVIMYQTSKNAGALIDIVSEVVPTPMATSLVNALFSKLPFSSDLSSAFRHGKAGMNFAFVDGFSDYHAATDTPERLALDSLQHLGDFALPLVRHFGGVELPVALEAERHYFNPLGHILISYPGWLDWWIWVVLVGVMVFACLHATKAGAYSLAQLVRGVGYALVCLTLPLFFIFLADRVIDQSINSHEVLVRQKEWFTFWSLLIVGSTIWLHGLVRNGCSITRGLIITSILALFVIAGGVNYTLLFAAVVLGGWLILVASSSLQSEAIHMSGLIFLLFLALVTLLKLGGGAYILLWPLLAITILEAFRSLYPKRPMMASWISLLVGLPALFLLGGTAMTFDLLVGYDLPFISVLPLALVLTFFTPLFSTEFALKAGATIMGVGLVTLSLLIWHSPWSPERPQPVGQFVLHDVKGGHSYWASNDLELTDWHRATLGSNPEYSTSALYHPNSNKPIRINLIKELESSSPKLELVDLEDENRQVTIRIKPAHPGDSITVWLMPRTELLSWAVDGQPLALESYEFEDWYSLTGFALPERGVEISLTFRRGTNWPGIRLTGIHDDLPNGLVVPARSALQVRGSYRSFSDSTLSYEDISLAKLILEKE